MRVAIGDGGNKVYVSAAAVWEIAIKKALGKLEAPEDLDKIVEEESFIRLAISIYHAESVGCLPQLHNDAFDRMLVAQAQVEGLTIVTADIYIPKYEIHTMDART